MMRCVEESGRGRIKNFPSRPSTSRPRKNWIKLTQERVMTTSKLSRWWSLEISEICKLLCTNPRKNWKHTWNSFAPNDGSEENSFITKIKPPTISTISNFPQEKLACIRVSKHDHNVQICKLWQRANSSSICFHGQDPTPFANSRGCSSCAPWSTEWLTFYWWSGEADEEFWWLTFVRVLRQQR